MAAARSGSAELRALAVRLKATGEQRLWVETAAALRAGAQPLVADVKQAAERQLPKRGGLNERVANEKVTVSVRTGARTAGVRLVTRAPATKQTDQGFVRHPTFGRRGKGQWKTEQIPQAAGWWSKTLAKGAPKVAPHMRRVLRDVGRMIQGRGL